MRKRRGEKKTRDKRSVKETAQIDEEQQWTPSLGSWAIALAIGACLLHGMHLAALFENDRFFSHLSPLERELSFRTEMGLYYSYYKRIVESPSLLGGVASILHDNLTEYPDTINTLQRFNLYPEVCLSVMFRQYRWCLDLLGMSGMKCFSITRGDGSKVEACNGER
ncbi:Probable C-mannosyltransferase DPY19L1 [Geodia barretti]|uniref:Probable C-mannosyltransferase DPY19L1 n=1 Tax=Geodia barretti TaxID=519541 RepID=A0AA35R7L9_GEOBA|nr:Probable C-mannosyltransferase DPY19L1 [Geodia barretti]